MIDVLDTKELKKIDQKTSLIPLTYDFAFKTLFIKNLDIFGLFLADVVHIPNYNGDIVLINNELPKDNKNEYKKTLDMFVVLNGYIYIDTEMNGNLFINVIDRNGLYLDKISITLLESGENIKSFKRKIIYQLNLNANKYENTYNDEIIVPYALKSKEIVPSNKYIVVKKLEYYRNLYYTKGVRDRDVIWLTVLTAKTFTELYELLIQVLDDDKVMRIMKDAISMSKDTFILHEWEKDKLDALVKYNEQQNAKNAGFAEGISQGIEQGIEKGKASRNIQIAKNMLKKNMNINDISEITGLSNDEIKLLKE